MNFQLKSFFVAAIGKVLPQRYKDNALIQNAGEGNISLMDSWRCAGAKVSEAAMAQACGRCQLDAVRWLADKGANIYHLHGSFLRSAVGFLDKNMVEFFLSRGMPINLVAQETVDELNSRGKPEAYAMVKWLSEKGLRQPLPMADLRPDPDRYRVF